MPNQTANLTTPVLAIGLLMLLVAFAHEASERVVHVWIAGVDETIVGMLSPIDLSLGAILVVVVMWAGYEHFVSKLDFEEPPRLVERISHIGYGDLKIKILTGMAAISAICVLEDFMHINDTWTENRPGPVGIHLTFIVSGVLLAVMDRLGNKNRGWLLDFRAGDPQSKGVLYFFLHRASSSRECRWR
jgi:uncharacterized protein (TIGR00645 family)